MKVMVHCLYIPWVKTTIKTLESCTYLWFVIWPVRRFNLIVDSHPTSISSTAIFPVSLQSTNAVPLSFILRRLTTCQHIYHTMISFFPTLHIRHELQAIASHSQSSQEQTYRSWGLYVRLNPSFPGILTPASERSVWILAGAQVLSIPVALESKSIPIWYQIFSFFWCCLSPTCLVGYIIHESRSCP